MGCPLNRFLMLALILYCDGDCNYDLSKSQRNGIANQKWPYFDSFLNLAIRCLSYFEEHQENIYTGICNVYYEFKDKEKNLMYFTSNISFTASLTVAQEFRGNEGLIIGLNPSRSLAARAGWFRVCDVSWISRFPSEQELLCKRGSMVCCYRYKMTISQTQKQQWLVCDEGNLQETSFQAMFSSHV